MDHSTRPQELCHYGCQQEAHYRVGKGQRPCCCERHFDCPGYKAKILAARRSNGKPIGFQNPEARKAAEVALLARYGVTSPGAIPSAQEKARATNLMRYGAENPFGGKGIQAKIRETMVTRYGAENPLHVEEIVAKRQRTFDERYGGNPQKSGEVRAKTAMTNQKRYGGVAPLCDPGVRAKAVGTAFVRYGPIAHQPWMSPDARVKRTATLIARYGVRYGRALNPLRHKSLWKSFVFPSGREVRVQGYEPEALALLLAEGVEEGDILVGRDVPRIPYTYQGEGPEGTRHIYFPDIYVKSRNLLIEVKSLWTYQGGKVLDGLGIDNPVYERNQTKHQAALLQGFRHQFWLKQNNGVWVRF